MKIEYPEDALQQCIEGWVLLRFSVTSAGMGSNVEVLDSEPPGVFDAAAVQAISNVYIGTEEVTNFEYKWEFKLRHYDAPHCDDT